MGEDKVCIGFVVGLDYTDATFSVHDALQEFKTHPFVRKILEGGKRVGWGAKTIPSGGYWALPRTFTVPGMVMCGRRRRHVQRPGAEGHPLRDARRHVRGRGDRRGPEAGLGQLRRLRRAGPQQRDRPGPLPVAQRPPGRSRRASSSAARSRTWRCSHGGALPPGRWSQHPDSEEAMEPDGASKRYPKPDNKYTFDKLSSVFASGNATRDDAPNHIKVQRRVPREVAQTWVSMCPAQVYEIPEDQRGERRQGDRPEHHAVELRAVRRDHRQGRPPDAARGRRRPALPGDLAAAEVARPERPACGRLGPWSRPISTIAVIGVVLSAIGIARAWELLGAQTLGLVSDFRRWRSHGGSSRGRRRDGSGASERCERDQRARDDQDERREPRAEQHGPRHPRPVAADQGEARDAE